MQKNNFRINELTYFRTENIWVGNNFAVREQSESYFQLLMLNSAQSVLTTQIKHKLVLGAVNYLISEEIFSIDSV